MEKVSIIIPCYNVENYISQCLESVLNQTYSNLEIICINDGSTDNTLSLIQKIALHDSRIIILDIKNSGVSFARNIALNESSGEFVMFVDSDDWLDLDTISSLFEFYNGEDILIFSYKREFKFGSSAKILPLQGPYKADFIQRRLLGPINEEKRFLDSIDSLAPVCCKIYKKSILPKNLIFKNLEKIGTWEDGFFNFEILNSCKNVVVINEAFYHYRKYNNNSITTLYKENLQKKWIVKFELLERILSKTDKNKTYFEALNNRVCITFLGLCLNEINKNDNFWKTKSRIENLLENDFYSNSFSNFSLRYIKIHWMVFYCFAKIKFTFGVVLLAYIIHFMINKKN